MIENCPACGSSDSMNDVFDSENRVCVECGHTWWRGKEISERRHESMMIGSLVNLTLWDLLLMLLLQTTAFYFIVIATLIAGVIVVLCYAILLRGPPDTKPFLPTEPWPPPPPKKTVFRECPEHGSVDSIIIGPKGIRCGICKSPMHFPVVEDS